MDHRIGFRRHSVMKNIDLRLIAELMKNSRRSDKELAKVIGVSQPTVARTRQRLEKEGYIQEYTIVPQYPKIGYEIMSLTFYKLRQGLTQKELHDMRKEAMQLERRNVNANLMIMNGVGLGYDLVAVTFHKSYSSYRKYVENIKESADAKLGPYFDVSRIESFVINLGDKENYQPLTFSKIADQLLKMDQEG
jgi:DNA-binding Lrp family transcriptional regulator